MRRERLRCARDRRTLAAAVLIAAARGRGQPARRHRARRQPRQARRARPKRMIETRNGIEVLKISRCGPQQAQGQARLLDLGLHVAGRGRLRRARCPTTAPARRSGSASATAGGSTSARTGCSRWRRCSTSPTRRRPSASTTTGSSSPSQSARPARASPRAGVARGEPAVGRRRADPRQLQLVRVRPALRRSCSTRGVAPAVGADRRPLLRAAEPGRLRERRRQAAPVAARLRRVRRLRGRRRQALPRVVRRSRSGTSPTTRSSGAGRPSPASTPRC